MKKLIFILSIICWANIGLFYLLYQIKFENILVGVFRELSLTPSFLGSIIFPIILIINILGGKE